LANVHIRSQNAIFYTIANTIANHQQHQPLATASTEIRLSDVIINITIIGMKTKEALKAAIENTCQQQLLWL